MGRKHLFAVILVTVVGLGALAACVSKDPAPTLVVQGDGSVTSGDGSNGGDGSATASDGGDAATMDADDGGDAGTLTNGFTVQSPLIDVPAGQEMIICTYLHTPNVADIVVKGWQSTLTVGVRHMALLFTATDRMAPGTVSAAGCTMTASDANPPSWAYSTWKANDAWSFPLDDGTGKPVGKPVKAAQSAYLLMHAINGTAATIKVSGSVDALGYVPGTAFTQAEPYVTFNGSINVPASATSSSTNTCTIPTGAKFNWMSTLSRKLSTHTSLKDGATVVFQSTDSASPGSRIDNVAPFAAFAGNQVTVQCDYTNGGAAPVTTGDGPNDETCMMLGYHFPATKPRLCVNDTLLP